jgi:hypothetical protein
METSNNPLAPNPEIRIDNVEVVRPLPIEKFDQAFQEEEDLLFDEADSLFDKRSEVKDSHDRY